MGPGDAMDRTALQEMQLIPAQAKVNQNRVITAKTMTSIRTVGTSFISR